MRKYIHSGRKPFKPSVNTIIYSGVSIDTESKLPVFNFYKDNDTDVISLKSDCSGEYDLDNVKYVYAYEYNNRSNPSHRKIFRDYLKGNIVENVWFEEDVEEFVENAVIKLDNYVSLSEIGCLVEVESTRHPSLTDVMRGYLTDAIGRRRTCVTDISLVKATYRDVKFDEAKARIALAEAGLSTDKINHEIDFTVKKFESLKRSGELFQMKRFTPVAIREAFTDYLKFANDEQRKVYMSLQGTNVLIYDDFITSGSTVREIVRLLRSIHDKNTLTVFILVKQH